MGKQPRHAAPQTGNQPAWLEAPRTETTTSATNKRQAQRSHQPTESVPAQAMGTDHALAEDGRCVGDEDPARSEARECLAKYLALGAIQAARRRF